MGVRIYDLFNPFSSFVFTSIIMFSVILVGESRIVPVLPCVDGYTNSRPMARDLLTTFKGARGSESPSSEIVNIR